MTMAAAVSVFLYAGAAIFPAGCLVRVIEHARAPVHLRWELYPVPHGVWGQLRIMIPEILLLKALWEENR
jgi:hypothetical protein